MDDNKQLAGIADQLATRAAQQSNDAESETQAEPELSAAPKKSRKKRVPVGRASARLSAPARLGYVRRFVNDTPGRVRQLENAGYEIVSDDTIATEDNGTQVVRTADRSTGMKTYLMETPQEYYDEDQKAKAAEIAATDSAIREGSLRGAPGVDGRYVDNISIDTK